MTPSLTTAHSGSPARSNSKGVTTLACGGRALDACFQGSGCGLEPATVEAWVAHCRGVVRNPVLRGRTGRYERRLHPVKTYPGPRSYSRSDIPFLQLPQRALSSRLSTLTLRSHLEQLRIAGPSGVLRLRRLRSSRSGRRNPAALVSCRAFDSGDGDWRRMHQVVRTTMHTQLTTTRGTAP